MSKKVITPAPEDFCKSIKYFKKSVKEALTQEGKMITSLVLPIKKKWFDMIRSGEKKEEYREIKPYWTKRFHTIGLVDNYGFVIPHESTLITLQNGYGKEAPFVRVWVKLHIADGYEKWGAEPGKAYYVLEIVKVC